MSAPSANNDTPARPTPATVVNPANDLITIRVNRRTNHCAHRLVLAAASVRFQELLLHADGRARRHRTQLDWRLPCHAAAAVAPFLRYCYHAAAAAGVLTVPLVLPLLALANRFHAAQLRADCIAFMLAHIPAVAHRRADGRFASWLSYALHADGARSGEHDALRSALMRFARWNVALLRHAGQLERLDVAALLAVLGADDVVVHGEREMYEAARDWLLARSPADRADALVPVLDGVRFTMMDVREMHAMLADGGRSDRLVREHGAYVVHRVGTAARWCLRLAKGDGVVDFAGFMEGTLRFYRAGEWTVRLWHRELRRAPMREALRTSVLVPNRMAPVTPTMTTEDLDRFRPFQLEIRSRATWDLPEHSLDGLDVELLLNTIQLHVTSLRHFEPYQRYKIVMLLHVQLPGGVPYVHSTCSRSHRFTASDPCVILSDLLPFDAVLPIRFDTSAGATPANASDDAGANNAAGANAASTSANAASDNATNTSAHAASDHAAGLPNMCITVSLAPMRPDESSIEQLQRAISGEQDLE